MFSSFGLGHFPQLVGSRIDNQTTMIVSGVLR